MATKASRIALAGSNISSTGEVDADLLDNIDSAAFLSLDGNGRLGIGASTLTAPLNIQADGDARTLRVIGRSDDYSEIDFYENDNSTILSRIQAHNSMFNLRAYDVPMQFQQSGNTKMTIATDGNVGIDEDTPLAKLHVVGGRTSGTTYNTIIAAGGVNSTDGSGARIILTGCENDPLARGTVIEGISAGTGNSHKLNFKTNSGSEVPATRMTIGPTGNVGIGTDNPQAKLHVEGNIRSSANIGVTQTDGDYLAKLYQSSADGFLELYTGEATPVSRVKLSSYGDSYIAPSTNSRLGIGTTSPTEKLHVAGVIRSEGYDTDSITSYNITGSYTAGTEYVFTTRDQINGLGYGAGFYKFLVWSDTFNTGTSHYQCYTPYDEFYHNNYGSNTSTVQAINYGVSMGHAPNTGTRAIDIRLRHKYGADATYPANQTFTFIPVNGFSGLTGAAGRHLRIYLFKVA